MDPEKATRWMGRSASLDPRPGGEYRVEVISGNVACGEFVELDPPHRLVWTWGWEPGSPSPVAPGSTTIEVELVPEGDGTRLLFTHSGLSRTRTPCRSTHTGGTTTCGGSRPRRAAATPAAIPGLTK